MAPNRINITTECFAAQEGKALITLGPDQLCLDSDRREQTPICLRLAQRWNAIMLIAESDCYVRARRSGDLEANSGRSLLQLM